MRGALTILGLAITLGGCVGYEPDGPSSATMTATGTSGTASGPDGSTTAPTTGAETTTGAAETCVPSAGPIAEVDFAKSFAEAICAQQEACGCAVDFSCAGVLAQSFQALVDFGAEHALAYDGACAGELLAAAVPSLGCATRSEFFASRECIPDCRIYTGEVPSGGPCPVEERQEYAYYSKSCAVADESCQFPDHVCGVYSPTILHEGDDCFSPMIGVLGECEEGTQCNYETLKCGPLVGEDDSCAGGNVCMYPYWCNEKTICQAKLPAGAVCTDWNQCESWRCLDGLCSDNVAICDVAAPEDLYFFPVP